MKEGLQMTVRCPSCGRLIVDLYVLRSEYALDHGYPDLEGILENIDLRCDKCGLDWRYPEVGDGGEVKATMGIGKVKEVDPK